MAKRQEVAIPSFIGNCLDQIRKVAPGKVKVGVIGTLRRVFEFEEGIRQFRELLEHLGKNPKIELVTAGKIVDHGIIWAGDLDATQKTVKRFIAKDVDVVLIVNCNYGDEEASATIAKEVNAATGCPIYTFVFPDLAFQDDGKRLLDNGCGILPTRQFARRNLKKTLGWIPTAPLGDEVFEGGLTDMLRISGAVRASRSVRALQIGAAQQTFPAIEADRQFFRDKFGTRVETLDGGTFRKTLQEGLTNPPAWMNDVLAYISQWIDFDKVTGKFPNTAKLNALAFGTALDLLVEKQSNCMTLNCWPDVMADLGFMYCPLNGLLFQHGIMAPCETDLPGIQASAMLQGLVVGEDQTKYIGCFADWTTFQLPEKRAMFWHCGPFAPSRCRGGACAQCREGWIIPVPEGCAGYLHGKWGEIGEAMTLAQIRPDDHDCWSLLAYNGKVVDGPVTRGTHFWLGFEDARGQETWNYQNAIDHHHSVMPGDYVRLIPEVARWLGLAAVTLDNIATAG